MNMYLDCDTTPAIRSRYLRGGAVNAVNVAGKLLIKAGAEGQIGVYENATGVGFKGYVIRYKGEEPHFEKAEGR